eukprot:scaffold47472_cov31-Prasinocladus_malaysianus.AAC.2
MDVDDDNGVGNGKAAKGGKGKGGKKGKVSEEFKQLVVKVLEDADFAEQRASKMNQDQFLALLAAFNQAGIHFA